MSEHISKRHNKNLMLYHIVCPIKYRKKVLTSAVERTVQETCLEIALRYEIRFVEIGADEDQVHFLTQSVPNMLPATMVKIIKSILAKEIFRIHPEVRTYLWGGSLWTMGYYINTVGQYANEEVIRNYVKNQGAHYQQLYRTQLSLFPGLA